MNNHNNLIPLYDIFKENEIFDRKKYNNITELCLVNLFQIIYL